MSYEVFSNKTRSQKFLLAQVESLRQFKIYSLYSGTTYQKQVDFFAIRVIVNGIELNSGVLPLNAGEFYFDITQKIVYFRLADDSDPKLSKVFVTFKHFFPNFPQNLP